MATRPVMSSILSSFRGAFLLLDPPLSLLATETENRKFHHTGLVLPSLAMVTKFIVPVVLLMLLLGAAALGGFAQSRTTQVHTIVLHAARLLDIENGKILTPGEVLVEGERIVEAGS